MNRICRTFIVALLACVAAAGCSNDPNSGLSATTSDASKQPPLGPVPVLRNAEDVPLLLDYYMATPQQRVTLFTANNMLIRDCMRRFGFDWQVQAVTPTKGTGRRYGISNRADVQNYGYNLPPDRRGGSQPAPGTFEPPSAAEQTVFTGQGPSSYNGQQIPAGGCNGEAARKFGLAQSNFDDLVNAGSIVQDLDLEANGATRADTRLAEVFARWSACMKESGYDYRTPWDANNDPAFDGDEISGKERSTALADLDCRGKHNVAGVNLAIETAYQKRLIDRHAEVLQTEKKKLEQRLRMAISIVAGK